MEPYDKAAILTLIIMILGIVVVFAAEVVIDNATYGDWTCVFKKCVVVKEKE